MNVAKHVLNTAGIELVLVVREACGDPLNSAADALAGGTSAWREAELSALPTGCLRVGPARASGQPFVPSLRRELQAARLDVLLHLGAAEPLASEGSLARHGLWRMRYGGSASAWPGLEEVVHGRAMTDVSLVRLLPAGDEVLFGGALPTRQLSWGRQLELLSTQTTEYAARALNELRLSGSLAGVVRSRSAGWAPNTKELAGLSARLMLRAARAQLRSIRRRAQWGVGIVPRPIHDLIRDGSLTDVKWLSPQVDFFADPFATVQDGRLLIYGEALEFAAGVGRIAWFDAGGDGAIQPVLLAEHHQSYPFLFEHQGVTYCLPERGDGRELALFKNVGGPGDWERVATLFSDRWLVDASIFRHEGRWWLWFTDLDNAPALDLHAYYADVLQGPWTPHALNPLKRDMASSRPAGTPFTRDGALYRPAQDCSETYGGATVIHRVDLLTPTAFRETVVGRVSPDPTGPWPNGVHTLSAAGDVTIVDGKRWVFSRHTLAQELRARAKRLLRR